MPARFALSTVTGAILCCRFRAAQPAQQDFPDGPGKATFVAHCGGCTTSIALARLLADGCARSCA